MIFGKNSKYRIVERFSKGNTYFYTQIRWLGVFWRSFNWELCNVTVVDRIPICYSTYDEAYDALVQKAKDEELYKTKKRKAFHYISI